VILKLPGGRPSGRASDQPAAGTGHSGRPKRSTTRLWLLVLAATTAVVAVAAGTASYLLARPQTPVATQTLRPSGVPASISTKLVNLMALSPLPHAAAPAFTLTDQTGHRLALSSLRGKAVVLEFMDPHCTDICPIVSQEFVDAYRELGPAASKVAFVAVNVNQYHASVADMATYSRAHQLNTIPSWHFFTGPTPGLRAVWRAYNIEVSAPNPNADILHTSAVYFIDRQGRERYLASPMVDHTRTGTSYLPIRQIHEWSHGIAVLARSLVS